MSAAGRAQFPFSAVVGHDEAKLALLLAAAEPAIGHWSQSWTKPPRPQARLPASAAVSEIPCRRSSSQVKTNATSTRRAAVTPSPEITGKGSASATSGCRAWDCGFASSGSPAPESPFQSGHAPEA